MAKTKDRYRAFITHNPLVDARFLYGEQPGELNLLIPYVPVGIAHFILKSIFSAEEIRGCGIDTMYTGAFGIPWLRKRVTFEKLLSVKAAKAIKLLRQIELFFGLGTFKKGNKVYPRKLWCANYDRNVSETVLQTEICRALQGRIFFREELEKSLREGGTDFGGSIFDCLQALALRGLIEILPSLGFTARGEVKCNRCGLTISLKAAASRQRVGSAQLYMDSCHICDYPSLYCERCNTMGEARLCRPLFILSGTAGHQAQVPCVRINPGGVPPLTQAQRSASRELTGFVSKGGKREALLWAVTGAGKTEVVMEVMADVMARGGRVLYASPRRDVVRELAPRFQAALTGVDILTDFGGSPEKFRRAPLVIATAHQAIRYYRHFDLVILDEVDAYPYRGDPMLEDAVKRAARPNGCTVYLTATPAPEMLTAAVRGRIALITIPARHHGHPVPEPEIKLVVPFHKNKAGQWIVGPDVPALLSRWCFKELRQVFVFLPTVRRVLEYGPALARALSEVTGLPSGEIVRFSHSADPDRDKKSKDFKEGRFRIFVTTTIMERGITVKRANVLVLEADFEKVFDEGSLVQMAGRAGRSAECPAGEVVFVSRRISGAMKKACEQIRFLNRVARREGYLVPE